MQLLLQSGGTKISGQGREAPVAHCSFLPPQHVNKACCLGLNFKSPSSSPKSAKQWGRLRRPESLFQSYTLSLCFLWERTDKRRKTEDRRKIQGLLRHAENFYLSRMLILVFTCRTESQREVQAKYQQGSRVQHSTQHTTGGSIRACHTSQMPTFGTVNCQSLLRRCLFLDCYYTTFLPIKDFIPYFFV